MQYKFKNAQNTTSLLISYVASIDLFNFSISSVFAYSIVSHLTSYILHYPSHYSSSMFSNSFQSSESSMPAELMSLFIYDLTIDYLQLILIDLFTNFLAPTGRNTLYYVALTALLGGGGVVPIGFTPYPLFFHPYGVLEFLSPEGAEYLIICLLDRVHTLSFVLSPLRGS